MLLHLAQGASADAGGWTVTTSIAAAAAVISLANLVVTTYFTGRRERMKWAREALAEAFYKYVDVSYRAKDAGRHLRMLMATSAASEHTDAAIAEVGELRAEMLDLQTRITLLAPTDTFERSQELRRKVDEFLEGVGEEVPGENYRKLEGSLAAARLRFVDSAKRTLGLPR